MTTPLRVLVGCLFTVATSATAQPAQAPLKLERVISLGDDNSSVILSSVTAAVLDRELRLVVGDYKEGTLLVIDRRGKEVSRFGRLGAGPGEFRAIDQIGWVGDTLWISDGTLRRMTFVHQNKLVRADGSFPALPAGLSFAMPLSVNASGVEFGVGSYSRGEVKPSLPGHLLYRRRRSSPSIDTILWLARTNSALVLNVTSGGRVSQLRGVQPLDDAPLAVARKSGGFIVVERPATMNGKMSRVMLNVYDANGVVAFQRNFNVHAVEVTPATRAGLRRVTVVESIARASVYSPHIPDANSGYISGVLGTFADGKLLGKVALADSQVLGLSRELFKLAVIDSGYSVYPFPQAVEGDERFRGDPDASGMISLSVPPFGRRTLLTVCPNSFWIGENQRFEFTEYDTGGRLLRRLTVKGIETDSDRTQALRESD